MEEWKDFLRVGRMGEAKLEGASLVTSGPNTCGLSPSSDMWGFGTDGGSGGLIITLGVSDVIIIFNLVLGYLELFIRQLSIFIFVSILKHLLNILILNRHRQVLHYVNKIILNKLGWAKPHSRFPYKISLLDFLWSFPMKYGSNTLKFKIWGKSD